MKPSMLCLLLLSACSYFTASYNYRAYALTWTCLSPEGCERADDVELIDRANIVNKLPLIDFVSTRDQYFIEDATMVPSDSLPAECFWIYDFSLFATEADPSRLCRTPAGFELELSIPNRDPTTRSKWFVEGREVDP